MAAVDLHLHSTASDGEYPPAKVVRRAAEEGLQTIALVDHDTLGGVPEACAAGQSLGVRIIAGCEFSVAAEWGELHLLGYFLPLDAPPLAEFLEDQREKRLRRGAEIVRRLNGLGLKIAFSQVLAHVAGGSVGRPHVAKVLVELGVTPTITEAFDRYLGRGRPAFVPKQLPSLVGVADLVRAVGGVTSAAHLNGRGSTAVLRDLKDLGVDGVEVLHPSHDERTSRRIEDAAGRVGLLLTGGSDWHGDTRVDHDRGQLGAIDVPLPWLERLETLHATRVQGKEAGP